jgi:hypothetical protein
MKVATFWARTEGVATAKFADAFGEEGTDPAQVGLLEFAEEAPVG